MSHRERMGASLREAIDEGVALFAGASEERTARRPGAGTWCAREIIGHLIDSACNNHRRFIINQDVGALKVEPYEQEAWVARGRYADARSADLVALWAAYNRQLARVIEGFPDESLTSGRGPTGSYTFPYSGLPMSDVVTLGHVVEDYIGHIRHHLAQVRSLLAD